MTPEQLAEVHNMVDEYGERLEFVALLHKGGRHSIGYEFDSDEIVGKLQKIGLDIGLSEVGFEVKQVEEPAELKDRDMDEVFADAFRNIPVQ